MPKTKSKPFSNFVNDLTGQKYGRLTVVSFVGISKHSTALWLCKCNCGKMVNVRAGNLRSNHTRSCGCLQRERARASSYEHGHADSRNAAVSVEYSTWSSMIQRCTNPKRRDYKWYGGRGIVVCGRWLNSFSNFLADMGRKPSLKHSIDRIDNDRNYEPGNCRWATSKQQIRNSRRRIFSSSEIIKAIELRRQGKTLEEVGKVLGVCLRTIWNHTHKVMEQDVK